MEQTDLLRYAIETLEQLNLPYALVGSFASGAYGEPRFTHDIDIILELHRRRHTAFLSRFPGSGFLPQRSGRSRSRPPHKPIQRHSPGIGEQDRLYPQPPRRVGPQPTRRRQPIPIFSDRRGYVASPEDVILGKMVYYREGGSEKHLRDITGILRISGNLVDRDYVANFSKQLGLTEIWEAVLARLSPTDAEGTSPG